MTSTSETVQTLPLQHVVLQCAEEASRATHPNTSKGFIFLPEQTQKRAGLQKEWFVGLRDSYPQWFQVLSMTLDVLSKSCSSCGVIAPRSLQRAVMVHGEEPGQGPRLR